MSKEQDILNLLEQTKIQDMHIEQEMRTSFMDYAMSVNISRAIPDARDGLKPVHRRILYAMHQQGITYDKPYKKCAKAVGDVMGKFHPHGDSSIYDALVRLAQNFSINEPLVDGHGNFGSVDGDGAAASRYTEARLSKISNEMLRDIEKDTVNFVPNYDGEEMEPTVLPARFPNLLVNGSNGIAVGMATNIPPHNLGEVIDGVVALIDNPEITCEDLINYVPAPDFPTKGIIMGTKGIRQAYLTGRGGIVLRSRAIIEEENEENKFAKIIFTEIPYQVNKKKAIRQALDLIKNKVTEDIHYVRDESDREGIRVVVELKKGASPEVVLNLLYKRTQFQISDGIIFLALDANQRPKLMNLKEMLSIYLEHQIEVITRRSKFDLNKAEERAHILDGLVQALANIDDIIATIKASLDRTEAMENLTTKFNLSEKQAAAILEMRLQRLTGLEKEKLEEELKDLRAFIEELNILLSSRENILAKVKEELLEIKEKYATPRKSEIGIDYSDINLGDLIKQEDVVITISHNGYIKRMPVTEYRAQNRGGRGVTGVKTKDEDFVENMFVTWSHNDLMFFTTKGKVYRIKAYEVPEATKTAKGRAIINLLEVEKDELIQAVLPVKEYSEDGYISIATKNGLIKKTHIKEYENIRKTGKIAITINEDDSVVGVNFTTGNDEILIATHNGKCIRFNENDVRSTGRTSMGVKAITLTNNDYVVDFTTINPESEFITISEKGYGKRSITDDYRLQSRGGKGVKAGNFNDKTGKLVNLKQVTGNDDIMIIASNGVIIRMHTENISTISRTTQGVKLMRLDDGVSVICLTLSEREDDEELAETNENTENLGEETVLTEELQETQNEVKNENNEEE